MPTTSLIAKPFFEPTDEALRYLPEGPRVLQNHPTGVGQLLGWVAIQHSATEERGSFNILDLSTRQNKTHALPGRPGFFAETTRPGVILVGLERRLAFYNYLDGTLEETGISVSDNPRVIINDGLAVEGGVFFGTKHLDFNQPVAALYFFDIGSRQLIEVSPGQTCSNGKLFLPDAEGAILIDTDTTPKEISRYRLDRSRRKILSKSLLIEPHALPAYPDGMRPTPDGGGILVAFYNPEAVTDGLARRYDLVDGAAGQDWVIPGSPRVTCPEFVELDSSIKVVFTTAVEGMSQSIRNHAPGAGSMYIADTPFDRLPASPPLLPL